jgi:phosphoenolpyruvate carboxykinase (ATP)
MFLTADAFGVLPPIARLTPDQARYHFLSGYTAKAAGTEVGITEPQATFSTCFGAPFWPLPPHVYADMLAEKMLRHGTQVYLLNTGWTGGPAGIGQRINLPYTRAIVRAALQGQIDDAEIYVDPVFGLHVPLRIPGVPDQLMRPRATWRDPAAYDAKARDLARLFAENFTKFDGVAAEVALAGPKI